MYGIRLTALDLEEAISQQKNAVDLSPDGHPDKPRHIANLRNSLLIRFERFGELTNLEHAISRHRNAVDLTPDDHPHKPDYINHLGNSLRARFERLGELKDLEEAISVVLYQYGLRYKRTWLDPHYIST